MLCVRFHVFTGIEANDSFHIILCFIHFIVWYLSNFNTKQFIALRIIIIHRKCYQILKHNVFCCSYNNIHSFIRFMESISFFGFRNFVTIIMLFIVQSICLFRNKTLSQFTLCPLLFFWNFLSICLFSYFDGKFRLLLFPPLIRFHRIKSKKTFFLFVLVKYLILFLVISFSFSFFIHFSA